MNAITKLGTILSLATVMTGCDAQIKNAKTETVKIYGNCEMCEKTIEDAAYKKGVAKAEWDQNTKLAVITYNSEKESLDGVLKRVAHAGYDNQTYLAPDDAYAGLPECCKYERKAKKTPVTNAVVTHHEPKDTVSTTEPVAAVNQFKAVFDAYFELKNALVKSDSKNAATKASELVAAVEKADMSKMETDAHNVWMSVYKNIGKVAGDISKTTNLATQRSLFSKLAGDMTKLAKVAKLENTVYRQNCPMYNDGKGADWLSTENAVKNPYYGSQMLTCGKTVETIK